MAAKDWERYHHELAQHKIDLTLAKMAEEAAATMMKESAVFIVDATQIMKQNTIFVHIIL